MKHVDKNAVKIWRIRSIIYLILSLLVLAGLLLLKYFFGWIPAPIIWVYVAILLYQIVWSVILEPQKMYETQRFDLRDDELIIENGILIKNHIKIPLVRIQNVETTVGPIMKKYHLKTLLVTTAGGGQRIELMNEIDAESLKKEITERIKHHERKQWI